MSFNRFLVLITLIVLFALGANAFELVSPDDGVIISDDKVTFSWSDFEGNISFYRIIFYNDAALQDIISSTSVTDEYVTIENLAPGTYHYAVEALNGSGILGIAGPRSITVKSKRPEFRIVPDLSWYEKDRFVALRISAPLGSEVEIKITGPGKPLEYSAKDLRITELKFFPTQDGNYRIDSMLRWQEHEISYKTSFNAGASYNLLSSPDEDTLESQVYSVRVSAREGQSPIKGVYFTYKSSDGDIEFSETGNDGNRSLNLEAGRYHFTFYKTGYKEVSRTIDVNKDISFEINLVKIEAEDDVSLQTQKDYGIIITKPENESRFNYNVVEFEFLTSTEIPLICMLSINEEQNSGYEVHATIKDVKRSGKFMTKPLSSGHYRAMVRCESGSFYDVSLPILFQMGDSIKKEDITSQARSRVSDLRKELGRLSPDMQRLVEAHGLTSKLLNYAKRLQDINDDYNKAFGGTLSNEEIEKKKEELKEEVSVILSDLPKRIDITSGNDVIIYLPQREYDDYSSSVPGLGDVKSLQEDLLLRLRVDYIEVDDMGLTKVSKYIDGYDKLRERGYQLKDIRIIEIIPLDIADYMSPLTPMTRIDGHSYEINPSDESPIEYYYEGKIAYDLIQRSITIIAPKESIEAMESVETGRSEITGAAILDGGVHIGGILAFVIVFSLVMIGGSFFIPGTRMNKVITPSSENRLKSYLKNLSPAIERDGPNAHLGKFQTALTLYESLPEERKEDYLEIMQFLYLHLVKESVSKECHSLETSIIFQERLLSKDTDLLQKSIDSLNSIIDDYGMIPSGMADDLKQRIIGLSDRIESLGKKL